VQISDAEWTLMNLVWQSSPIDASQFIDQLGEENGWQPTTIKTMLHRLVRKGALATEQVGKKYLYKPAVRRDVCIRQASKSFVQTVFGGDAVPALMHFVKNNKISATESAEIRALLDSKITKDSGD
jgi:BlaI family transcriptional regulator, penicillinase repressor